MGGGLHPLHGTVTPWMAHVWSGGSASSRRGTSAFWGGCYCPEVTVTHPELGLQVLMRWDMPEGHLGPSCLPPLPLRCQDGAAALAPPIAPQAWMVPALERRPLCSHQASSGPELLWGNKPGKPPSSVLGSLLPTHRTGVLTTAAALVLQRGMLTAGISHQLPS